MQGLNNMFCFELLLLKHTDVLNFLVINVSRLVNHNDCTAKSVQKD